MSGQDTGRSGQPLGRIVRLEKGLKTLTDDYVKLRSAHGQRLANIDQSIDALVERVDRLMETVDRLASEVYRLQADMESRA
jgi:thiamine biosynthesis lipoprotein ApbE